MSFDQVSGRQVSSASPVVATPSSSSKRELAAANGEILVQTREEKEAAAVGRAGMSKKELAALAAANGETLVQTREEKEAAAAAMWDPTTTDIGTEQSMGESENLMAQIKAAGVAGVISYAFWELGFWTISVPVCIVAYYQVTGHWPDFSDKDDVAKLGAEAFAFVNVARFAVPLRIGLALGTTPWVQANIVDPLRNGSTFDFLSGGADVPESYLDSLEKQASGRSRSSGQGNIMGATSYLDALAQQEFEIYDYYQTDDSNTNTAGAEDASEKIVIEKSEDAVDNEYANAPEAENTNEGDSEQDNGEDADQVDAMEAFIHDGGDEDESEEIRAVVGFGMSYLDGLQNRKDS